MTEQEWLECTEPQKMLEFLRGRASDRKLRLIACGWCRRVWPLLTDETSRRAVVVAEQYVGGRASRDELIAAFEAASVTASAAMDVLWPRTPLGWLRSLWSLPAGVRTTVAVLFAAQAASVEIRFLTVASMMQATAEKHKGYDTQLLRELFGNPFRPVTLNSAWLAWNDGTVTRLAQSIYDDRAFDRLPILADALEEAGCDDAELLGHLPSAGPHVLGCWAVDTILDQK